MVSNTRRLRHGLFRLLLISLVNFPLWAQSASAQEFAISTPSVATAYLETPSLSPLDYGDYLQWLDTEISTIGVPGVALGIVRANEVMDVRTWGVRSLAQEAPVDSKTLFRIASVSKTFAGAVTAKLVYDQKQSWDGVMTVLYGAPLSWAIAHQLGAVILVVLVLGVRFRAAFPIPDKLRKA